MKKIISLILCITLFSPLFLIFANAETAITKTEAAELITKMADFHYMLVGLDDEGCISKLPGVEVTDKDLYEQLVKISGHYPSENLVFFLGGGEYGELSYWHDRLGEFLTEDYVKKNIEFNWAIFELDNKMYRVDAPFYATAPGFPVLISDGAPLEDHIKIVDNDTVLLEGFFDDRQWMPVYFEYTENGWRISGGEGTKRFMRFASHSITRTEAANLITAMYKFKEHSITTDDGSVFLGELPSTPITDKTVFKRLCDVLNYHKFTIDLFSLLDGEYGKLSFWHEYIKEFMTDDYVENNLDLHHGLIELGDKVYTIDPACYSGAPDRPNLCGCGLTLEEHITLIDNDTVLLEAHFDGYEPTKYRIDFEHTENGWRISGGAGVERFMAGFTKRETENPETGDNILMIAVCMAVSSVGIAYGVSKRRASGV